MTSRLLIALLLCPLAWGAAFTSKATGNWSAAGQTTWNEAGVPGNGDTVSIADTHTVTVDTDTTVGASTNGYYSYFSSIAITDGGSGYAGACTVVVGGVTPGTPNSGTQQGFSCAFTGGVLTSIALTLPRQLYAAASDQPDIVVKCGASACVPQPTLAPVWAQGVATAAIHLNKSGKLVLGAGWTLTVRGSILYTNASSGASTDALEFSAGSRLIFDPSAASALSDGSYPMYTFGADGTMGYRHLAGTACTAVAPCTLTSTGVAQLGNGFGRGQGVRFNHMAVSNMGDTVSPWLWSNPYSTTQTVDIQDSTLTNCGLLYGTANWDNNATFRIVGTTFAGTRPAYTAKVTFLNAIGTGVRDVSRNVFDKGVFDPAAPSAPRDLTMNDNYFAGSPNVNTTWAWASYQRNFLRVLTETGEMAAGDVWDTYYLADAELSNPHVLNHKKDLSTTLDGLIFGLADRNPGDSGELILLVSGNPTVPTQHYYNRIISLPSAAGYSWNEFMSIQQANWRVNLTHSNWLGGMPTGGFGMVQINEGSASAAGSIADFRSNIIHNPHLTGYVPGGTQAFMKVVTSSTTVTTEDVGSPANLDYNVGWHNALTQTACGAACPNQGNGYGGRWSATPGAHDIAADPQFADYQRTVELFDSKYLGNTASAWVSGQAYSLGDFVSASDATVYWGLAVNFRCAAAGGCTGTLKPGVPGTAWRADGWEWASLYRLRVANGSTYASTYPIGGLSASAPSTCTVTSGQTTLFCVMMAWIRQGYIPQNPKAWCAGHDGASVGAVDFCARGKAMMGAIQ